MAEMNIEQLIDEIAVYVDNCRSAGVLGGGAMIRVNKDEMKAMLDELRAQIPREVSESRQIIRTKDTILADARSKADQIISDAAREAGAMVDKNEIVNLANMRAKSIEEDASKAADTMTREAADSAREVQIGALQYTKNLLEGLEDMYKGMIATEREYFDVVIAKLEEEHKTIMDNRHEIDLQLGAGPKGTRSKEEFEGQEKSEE